jgi:hypothetical protein
MELPPPFAIELYLYKSGKHIIFKMYFI